MNSTEQETFLVALHNGAESIGVPLTPEQGRQCLLYAERLLAYNAHTNLTRITEPGEVAAKHFVDSLTVLTVCGDLRDGTTLADVGTGAGFPGLALALAQPALRVTLIDSLGKRLTFLREVVDALSLTNRVTLVHARAEDAGRDPKRRDRYDLVTARAVAALPTLLEWCGPLVRVGGQFVALKSYNIENERIAGDKAASLLGLPFESDNTLVVPVSGNQSEAVLRRVLVYRKTIATPASYPRRGAEIKTKPLGA